MSASPDTGNLALISFDGLEAEGEVDFTAMFVEIGELDRAIGKLEVSSLDTEDEKEYVPDDLAEPGEIECIFFWEGKEPPKPGEISKVTVTYPTAPGQSAPASYTASGFFMNQLMPSAKNGELMKGKAKFALDGRRVKFAFTEATLAT